MNQSKPIDNSNSELELVREVERLTKSKKALEHQLLNSTKTFELQISQGNSRIKELESLLNSSMAHQDSISTQKIIQESLELRLKYEEIKDWVPSPQLLSSLSPSSIFTYDALFKKLEETMDEMRRIKEGAIEAITQSKISTINEISNLQESLELTKEVLKTSESRIAFLSAALEKEVSENKRLITHQEELVTSAIANKSLEIEVEYQRREGRLLSDLQSSEEKVFLLEVRLSQSSQKVKWLEETLNEQKTRSNSMPNQSSPLLTSQQDSSAKEHFPIEKVIALEDELSLTKSQLFQFQERNRELSMKLSGLDFTHSKLASKYTKLMAKTAEDQKRFEAIKENLMKSHESKISLLQSKMNDFHRKTRVTRIIKEQFDSEDSSSNSSCSDEEATRKVKTVSNSLADEVRAIRMSLSGFKPGNENENNSLAKELLSLSTEIENSYGTKTKPIQLSNQATRSSTFGVHDVSYLELQSAYDRLKEEKKEILSDLISSEKTVLSLNEEIKKLRIEPEDQIKLQTENSLTTRDCYSEASQTETLAELMGKKLVEKADEVKEQKIKVLELEGELKKTMTCLFDLQNLYCELKEFCNKERTKHKEDIGKVREELTKTFKGQELDILRKDNSRLLQRIANISSQFMEQIDDLNAELREADESFEMAKAKLISVVEERNELIRIHSKCKRK